MIFSQKENIFLKKKLKKQGDSYPYYIYILLLISCLILKMKSGLIQVLVKTSIHPFPTEQR